VEHNSFVNVYFQSEAVACLSMIAKHKARCGKS